MRAEPETILVVPFYNEADRIRGDAFTQFAAAHPSIGLLLVDDGSTDGTRARLEGLAGEAPSQMEVLGLPENTGKAEAVRRGMLEALARGPRYAGYWDGDLATPLDEAPGFVEVLEQYPEREIVFGSRVLLLGRSIERRTGRHYLGRVFATVVSRMLHLAVYDTQCGAKLFRASEETRALFQEPFVTNWTFDVEVIARLIQARRGSGQPGASEVIYELPLRTWRDVPGSKVTPVDFFRGLLETLRIHRRYLRSRA
jgi:glycosyltransferase involved in cell wall biosynthesis